jgi:hypothetical protein
MFCFVLFCSQSQEKKEGVRRKTSALVAPLKISSVKILFHLISKNRKLFAISILIHVVVIASRKTIRSQASLSLLDTFVWGMMGGKLSNIQRRVDHKKSFLFTTSLSYRGCLLNMSFRYCCRRLSLRSTSAMVTFESSKTSALLRDSVGGRRRVRNGFVVRIKERTKKLE